MIFGLNCTFLPVPDAALASCVERSSSPACKMFQVQPTLGHPDGKEQTIHYTGIPLF